MDKNILIYGATGYTGKLLAWYMVSKGLSPVLGGRSEFTEDIAESFELKSRVFDVENAAEYLEDIDVLINVAGPFNETQDHLIKACLESRTHYLDICGGFSEVKNAFQYNELAQKNNIYIIPGAGFGTALSNVAANLTANSIKSVKSLSIARVIEGGISRGTLKTVLKNINKSGFILKNGDLVPALPAEKEITVTIDEKSNKAFLDPGSGDIYAATKIEGLENYEAYTSYPAFMVKMMKGKLNWLNKFIQKVAINWLPEGPKEKHRKASKTYVRAIATGEQGIKAEATIIGPEAYQFTVSCLYELSTLILNKHGSGVVSTLYFGTDWIKKIENVTIKMNTD